jgi:hypothetical protein
MTILRSSACLAILAGIAAAMISIPAGNRAEAAMICPQFVAEYCVVEKDGFRHTAWTNPCFAMERGARVLHMGACQGPICTMIWMPVCSINPITHRHHTYANQCVSDAADATLIHKGACHHRH